MNKSITVTPKNLPKKDYRKDGKCTAVKEHLCRYFAQYPFNRRYQLCFYRDGKDCKHSMDLVVELNEGRREI